MHFRLQFSLLGFLAVIAVLGVGLKLWIGPHRVDGPTKPGEEAVYTYYRTWNGAEWIDGPKLVRWFNASGDLAGFSISCFRGGRDTLFCLIADRYEKPHATPFSESNWKSPVGYESYLKFLTDEERQTIRAMYQRESQRLATSDPNVRIAYGIIPGFNVGMKKRVE
ncbi:MAG: hypothetical protein QM811_01975 [Pirellulales bacterium]